SALGHSLARRRQTHGDRTPIARVDASARPSAGFQLVDHPDSPRMRDPQHTRDERDRISVGELMQRDERNRRGTEDAAGVLDCVLNALAEIERERADRVDPDGMCVSHTLSIPVCFRARPAVAHRPARSSIASVPHAYIVYEHMRHAYIVASPALRHAPTTQAA